MVPIGWAKAHISKCNEALGGVQEHRTQMCSNRTEKVFIKMYGSLLQTSIHHKTIITIICDHFSYLSRDAHLLKKMCHVSEQYLTL